MTKVYTDRQFEIIEAAGKILTNAGVGGLTIKNLAKEMQFSESAIYRHFMNKEEIIVAMLEYLIMSLEERYKRVTEGDLNSEEKFILLFENLFSFFKSNPHFVVAVFSDGLLEENNRINETILMIMDIKIKYLRPIIQSGQKNKIFIDTIPADDLLPVILGTVRLKMFKWRLSNFKENLDIIGQNTIQILLKLIKYS